MGSISQLRQWISKSWRLNVTKEKHYKLATRKLLKEVEEPIIHGKDNKQIVVKIWSYTRATSKFFSTTHRQGPHLEAQFELRWRLNCHLAHSSAHSKALFVPLLYTSGNFWKVAWRGELSTSKILVKYHNRLWRKCILALRVPFFLRYSCKEELVWAHPYPLARWLLVRYRVS